MKYREGPVGALMDEYERAVDELKEILTKISIDDFIRIIDHNTKDEDCRSIQTIIDHVITAGYTYSDYIRKQFNDKQDENIEYQKIKSPQQAIVYLDKMTKYASATLNNKWNISDEVVMNNIIKTKWGQDYDIEQLLEHAIVHILRHRRQIERFLMIHKNESKNY